MLVGSVTRKVANVTRPGKQQFRATVNNRMKTKKGIFIASGE